MIGVWVATGLTIVWCGAAYADARPEVASVATIPRTARLYYQKAGTSGCPDVEVIQRAVAERLGYDPFAEIALITILVAITVDPGDVLRARISVIDSGGDEHGQREVVTPSHDCDELAATVGLIVSLTIPMMIAREEAEAQRLAQEAALAAVIRSGWMPLPSPAENDRPVTVASPTARGPHVVLGATASAGAVPGVALGAKLGIGLRRRSTSFAIELGADFGRATQVGDGEVHAARYRALLAGCRATGALEVCLLVAGGATLAQGIGFLVDATSSTPYAAVGVRAALERALPRGFSVVIHADMETAVVGASLQVTGPVEWQWIAPAVTATLGLAVRMELP